MSFLQYLKDTRAEMRHVAWPTQMQTIMYTIIVIGISLFVAAYLGFFDYIFTTGLGRVLQVLPQTPTTIESPISTSTEDIIIGTDSTSSLQVTPVPLAE
ncbi:preprotein translocase subunit SecE [Candidatus Kaiserbacteria bacterium]|nr:preprotein translocase subunit SecE [Candidatus Kaiserbacteria bacterium]